MKTELTRQKQCCGLAALTADRIGAVRLRKAAVSDHRQLNILLPVRLCPQETEGWCWAASVEMILDCLGAAVSQRELAHKQFSTNSSCPDPHEPCRGGAWPEFEKYGFTCKTTYTALSWKAVTRELGRGRPFAFCRKWDHGHYHIMVVSGCYLTSTGRRYIQIHNPSPTGVGAIKKVPYRQYVQGNGFAHERTYYEIKKQQP